MKKEGQAGLEGLMPVVKVDSNMLLFASLLCTACIFAVHSYSARLLLTIPCCKAGGWSTESSGVSLSSQLVAHMGFKSRSWLQSLCGTHRHVSPSHMKTESWRWRSRFYSGMHP